MRHTMIARSFRLSLWAIGLSLIVTNALRAQEAAFSNRLQFLTADTSRVRAYWHAAKLESSRDPDSILLSVMTEVESAAQFSAPLFWKTGSGSETHPRFGIGLDSVQIRHFREQDGLKDQRLDLVVLLGHELAHFAQGRYYSLETLADSQKARAIEAQADILAGMTAIWRALAHPQRDSVVANHEMAVMTSRMSALGTQDYDPTHHPRSEQRMRAFSTGLLAGLQLSDIRRCSNFADQEACNRAIAGRKNPEIADLGEDFWTWSNRLAKRIAQLDTK